MNNEAAGWLLGILLIVGVILGLMFGLPPYFVWKDGLAGQAQLKMAESNRQIKVYEAQAALEAAKLYAQADVERAKGHDQANHILKQSLGGPENYLRWLWIDTWPRVQGQTIYIPTEAGVPITEARRK